MKLALSGGGFRATLFHLGVIRYLRESGRLKDVTHVFSVSGGSIMAAHLILNWGKYTGDDDAFAEAAKEVVNFTQSGVRPAFVRRYLFSWLAIAALASVGASQIVWWNGWRLGSVAVALIWLAACLAIGWRFRHSLSTAAILERRYTAFFRGKTLGDIRASGKKLYLLATNLTTGDVAYFSGDGIRLTFDQNGPGVLVRDQFPIAKAVAASSAFPAAFPPVIITKEILVCDDKTLPYPHYLTDGGVYDNFGIRAAKLACPETANDELIVSNAEVLFDHVPSGWGFEFLLGRSLRSTDIFMQRISTLENELLVAAPAKTSAIRLQDDHQIPNTQGDGKSEEPFFANELQFHTRKLRTDLDDFSPVEIQSLYWQGYGLARFVFTGQYTHIPGTAYWKGLPCVAPPNHWLPISNELATKISNPAKSLEKGARRSRKLWSSYDAFTYLLLLVIGIAVAGSYPLLWVYDGWYFSRRIVPTELKWTVKNWATIQPDDPLVANEFVFSALGDLSTSDECATRTQAVVTCEKFGDRTDRRSTPPFQVEIETKAVRDLRIAAVRAYKWVDEQRGIAHLEASLADNRAIVSVGDSGPGDQLVIAVLLCGDGANNARSLREVLNISSRRKEQ